MEKPDADVSWIKKLFELKNKVEVIERINGQICPFARESYCLELEF